MVRESADGPTARFPIERGTTDGIYVAKRVQQITDKMKKPTFVLFVDLPAAFDHVERSWVSNQYTNGLRMILRKS